jgi:hypothetical protein
VSNWHSPKFYPSVNLTNGLHFFYPSAPLRSPSPRYFYYTTPLSFCQAFFAKKFFYFFSQNYWLIF